MKEERSSFSRTCWPAVLELSLHIFESDGDYGPAGPSPARHRQAIAEVLHAEPPNPPPPSLSPSCWVCSIPAIRHLRQT
jgi:hypothetical protein